MIDQVYFETIYKQWSGKVYNFILGLSSGDQYLAEEIVQSTFLKVWENRHSIDLERNVGAYIFSIAKNQLYNHFSHEELKAIYQRQQEQASQELVNTADENIDYQILKESIQLLVKQMPPSRRKIFSLSREQHLSNKEIASLLDISENTVESQMNKALKFLRVKLKILGHSSK